MKLSNNVSAGIGLLCLFILFGCGEQEGGAKPVVEMPTFPDATLCPGAAFGSEPAEPVTCWAWTEHRR